MEEYQSISRLDIENSLSNESLRISRIISSAMVIGPFLFLLLIIFLNYNSEQLNKIQNDLSEINSFIYVFIVIAVVIYFVFLIFPKIFLKPERIRKSISELLYDQNMKKIEDPVTKLIILDRQFMIIRLAMLEGVSLFGLIILFLAASGGQLSVYPNLWFLALPLLIQAYFSFSNFFPKSKYVDRIEKQFLTTLRGF